MLPLIPILLVLAVLIADSGLLLDLGVVGPGGEPGVVVLLAIAPTALVMVLAAGVLAVLHSSVQRGRPVARLADRILVTARWLILLNYLVAVLSLDWLGTVRSWTGGMLLVDIVLVLLPPIVGLIGLWWAWYPIERRLHEEALLQRLDRGLPIHLPLGRWPYVLTQLRLHILLMLVPMLLIIAAAEALEQWMGGTSNSSNTMLEILTAAAALVVLGFSPWIARILLGLEVLPEGEVRVDMQTICQRHRVHVRNIMLWCTRGTMINAAVIGFLPRVRYLVLTDGLLEQVRRDQVQAVMAHEVGHVKHRHMIWLLLCLLATVAVAQWLVMLAFWLFPRLLGPGTSGDLIQVVLLLIVVFLLFGWISRRFERQADTFAVQHLSMIETKEGLVTDRAVESMEGALMTIAALHAVDPERSSWRHGSIAWRCGYLQTLAGKSLSSLMIDRTMLVIRLAALVILLLTLLQFLLGSFS